VSKRIAANAVLTGVAGCLDYKNFPQHGHGQGQINAEHPLHQCELGIEMLSRNQVGLCIRQNANHGLGLLFIKARFAQFACGIQCVKSDGGHEIGFTPLQATCLQNKLLSMVPDGIHAQLLWSN